MFLSFVQMGYMTVEAHTGTLLHLKRCPGIRSWSLLVGKWNIKTCKLPLLIKLSLTLPCTETK